MTRFLTSVIAFVLVASPVLAGEIDPLPETRYTVRDTATTAPAAFTTCRRLWRRRVSQHPQVEFRIGDSSQLETDLDDGGRLSVNRFVAQARFGWERGPGPQVAGALSYRLHSHRFRGSALSFPARPWSDVHQVSVTVPVFVPIARRWTLHTVSEVRAAFEDEDAWDKGLSAGGIYGATYRVNSRLTIGPAVGVFTQIEDDPLLFPFIFVDWRICPKLRLRSGRAISATQGFGVFLEWDPSPTWRVTFGGRSERLRFRLDGDGVAPNGVGEHAWTSVFVAWTSHVSRRLKWTLSTGAALGGELRIEDRRGSLVAKDEYSAAAYASFDVQIDL